jgi:hypothetical protein
VDENRDVRLFQQGTYAPDGFYRWMASPAMDRQGNIGIGYSFGGTPNFAGQRFAGRLATDPPGLLTLHEAVLVHGQAAQTNTLRWQDYTQTAMDPTDDCTIWYVGDYLKEGAPSYTARIGAFRLPGCLRASVNGTSYFDVDHDGLRDPNEPGLADRPCRCSRAAEPADSALRHDRNRKRRRLLRILAGGSGLVRAHIQVHGAGAVGRGMDSHRERGCVLERRHDADARFRLHDHAARQG